MRASLPGLMSKFTDPLSVKDEESTRIMEDGRKKK
jgi:hypothetical protein